MEQEHQSWISKNIAFAIDIVIVSGFMLMLALIVFHEIPTSNKELFYTSFGILGGKFGTIVDFWRSSSAGSKEKTKQMTDLLKGKDK